MQHAQNIGNVKKHENYITLYLTRGDYESPETECQFLSHVFFSVKSP